MLKGDTWHSKESVRDKLMTTFNYSAGSAKTYSGAAFKHFKEKGILASRGNTHVRIPTVKPSSPEEIDAAMKREAEVQRKQATRKYK